MARIELGRSPGMQCNGGDTGTLGGFARLFVCQMVLIDALAHLHGDGNVAGSADSAFHNLAKEALLPGKGGAATLLGHFGNRAAKVQIDVIAQVLVDQELDRFRDGLGVNAIELNTAGSF